MPYLLGVDIGTEGTKVVVVDEKGHIVTKAYQSYSFDVPQSGWAEQDPIVWWEALKNCLNELWDKGVNSHDIIAMGVAGQMHSSVLLDHQGEVVIKSILWNDGRTKEICDQALLAVGKEKYQAQTCNSLLPGFTLGKLLWIKENLPIAYQRIEHVLMPKDYINYRLTQRYTSDVTDASGTGVFDVRERCWNDEIISKFGLPRTWFPEVFESGSVIGSISMRASEETGLQTTTLVIAGAADNAAAAVGMGIVSTKRGLVSIGTSGVILCCLDQPPSPEQSAAQNPTLHVFCHAISGMWYAMGVTLAAGASLKWFRDSLGDGQSYDSLMAEAAKIECGSDGLFYLPFLMGERTPYNSDRIRAAFLGVHMGHRHGHFVKSVIEGVAYSLKDCFDVVRSVTDCVEEFTVTGGVINSSEWLHVLADVLDASLTVPDYSEGAALGVAMLSGMTMGWQTNPHNEVAGSDAMHKIGQSDNRVVYEEKYLQYKALAASLLATSLMPLS
jgi:xylulokinase